MNNIHLFNTYDLTGRLVDFKSFHGKVLLIVNTASECGFTPQLAGLQTLHKKYHEQGLVVIGFPCNQFGGQEPYDGAAISEFCQKNYGVDFLMMQKVIVNGDDAHPIFKFLKSEQGGFITDDIKWNFTKFLVAKDGSVVKRYAPTTKPESLEQDIQTLLKIKI